MNASQTVAARRWFGDAMKELHRPRQKPLAAVRSSQAADLIEQYALETDEVPLSRDLEWLANYLLVDLLADQYKHHRHDDAPILSQRQQVRWQNRPLEFREAA